MQRSLERFHQHLDGADIDADRADIEDNLNSILVCVFYQRPDRADIDADRV